MTRRAAQVYITPEQHRAVQDAGCPMTAIIRELVEQHLMAEGRPSTDLSDLAGAVRIGRQTDVAADRDGMLADAVRGLR